MTHDAEEAPGAAAPASPAPPAGSTASASADAFLARAREAAAAFLALDQAAVDRVTEAAFRAAFDARFDLARRAIEETRLGIYEHKVVKNAWASVVVYQSIRRLRTVGVLAEDPASGLTEIAHPRGPVVAILPVTNPTSTAIFKALICLKTRNPVIFSPHGYARRCVAETCRVIYEAALAAGAPEHAIQWLTTASKEMLDALLEHRHTALILATAAQDIVGRAQHSGTPTFGVGPGNVPVYVDATADFAEAARKIVHSKTFDNGTVCASEQSLIMTPGVAHQLIPLMEARRSYLCSSDEASRLAEVVFNREARIMRPEAVGQPAERLAQRAGFVTPVGTRLLLAETASVGRDDPLSHEILAPVLALHLVANEEEALRTMLAVLRHGGEGHTAGIYTRDDALVARWQESLTAARVLVNQPTTTGAIGGVMNRLDPSLTLGCGPAGGNISEENITARNLLTISRVSRERPNPTWFSLYTGGLLDHEVGSDRVLDTLEGR